MKTQTEGEGFYFSGLHTDWWLLGFDYATRCVCVFQVGLAAWITGGDSEAEG